jgi:hypothetical protein
MGDRQDGRQAVWTTSSLGDRKNERLTGWETGSQG